MKRNNVKQITIRLTADEYAHVKQLSKDSGLKMEPAIGLEPTTSSLPRKCSTC